MIREYNSHLEIKGQRVNIKMEKIKKVCAVFDMQGFFADKVFYPREFSIVNNEVKICFEIDCDIPDDVKLKSFKHFSFQTHQLHGIPIKNVLKYETKRVLKLKNLSEIIYEIYCNIRTDEKPYIAIKNQQMCSLMESYEIPYVNLEIEQINGEICPPLHMFDKVYVPPNYHCLLHYILSKNTFLNSHRCALRKSVNIWNWINQMININSIIEIINFFDTTN